jgi:hypothetical protein
MPSALLPPLLAAIEPIAAYVNRTPAGNKHADHCADLINATSDYVSAVAAENEAREAEPNWQAIAAQMVAHLAFPPPTNPVILRCQQHLAKPSMRNRAAPPLAQRMYLATANSHNLGFPDYLR